jgi:hypothetical protein
MRDVVYMEGVFAAFLRLDTPVSFRLDALTRISLELFNPRVLSLGHVLCVQLHPSNFRWVEDVETQDDSGRRERKGGEKKEEKPQKKGGGRRDRLASERTARLRRRRSCRELFDEGQPRKERREGEFSREQDIYRKPGMVNPRLRICGFP